MTGIVGIQKNELFFKAEYELKDARIKAKRILEAIKKIRIPNDDLGRFKKKLLIDVELFEEK